MTVPPRYGGYLDYGYAESLLYYDVMRVHENFYVPRGSYASSFTYNPTVEITPLQKDATHMKYKLQTWLDGKWVDKAEKKSLSEAMNYGEDKAWAKGPDNLMHGIDEGGYLSRVLVVKGQWQLYRRGLNERDWAKEEDYDSVSQAQQALRWVTSAEIIWVQNDNAFYGINRNGTAFKILRED